MMPMVPNNQVVIQAEYAEFDKTCEKSHVLSNFAQISKIYRESGHPTEISNYLKDSLQKAGFEVVQKNDGTVCASRSVNKEHTNAIILQAHMDMVAISADGNPKKSIKIRVKDGWIYANDRTLGADDGIGVAAILSIAEEDEFKNYPLEMIITTNEETGMDGARNLKSEDFYGTYLINLDSEQFGDIVKGCAGIAHFNVNEKIKTITLESDDFEKVSIKISGARGGHSATVTPDTLNPIKFLLAELGEIPDLKLVSFSGGERYNAIPRDAEVVFLIPKSEVNEVGAKLTLDLDNLKKISNKLNPNLDYSVSFEAPESEIKYISPEFQSKMIKLLNSIPVGLLSKFENGTSKTSQNLGTININKGDFSVQFMGRSADEHEGLELCEKTSATLSELFGKNIPASDKTPIWQPKENSKLQNVAVETYSEIMGGEKPIVAVEHGGLESAIFIEKKPSLDQISIGPTLKEPHSIQEAIEVKTVEPFYNWLKKILEGIKKD